MKEDIYTQHLRFGKKIKEVSELKDKVLIKFDDTPDEDWLILIYLNSESAEGNIIIEDKSNHEKNFSKEFKPSEIFQASDKMVESLTQLLDRERNKKKAS